MCSLTTLLSGETDDLRKRIAAHRDGARLGRRVSFVCLAVPSGSGGKSIARRVEASVGTEFFTHRILYTHTGKSLARRVEASVGN